jgi:hypothetical protein
LKPANLVQVLLTWAFGVMYAKTGTPAATSVVRPSTCSNYLPCMFAVLLCVLMLMLTLLLR